MYLLSPVHLSYFNVLGYLMGYILPGLYCLIVLTDGIADNTILNMIVYLLLVVYTGNRVVKTT